MPGDAKISMKVGVTVKYSKREVMQYVQEEEIKFIRLAFCDVFGRRKNCSSGLTQRR